MIKAILRGDQNEKEILLIGLSEENIKRLKDKMPIQFDLPEVSHSVIIMAGDTEESMYEDLKKMVACSSKESSK